MALPTAFRRLSRSIACAALTIGLTACSMIGGGSVPSDSFYRLAAGDVPMRAGGPLPGAVDVVAFRGDGMLNDRGILHREGAQAIAAYNYNFWWQPPGAMLQNSLVDALRRANAFQLVTTPELRLDRNYEIVGRIRRFEQVDASVNVEVELLLRATASGTPLLLKTYAKREPAGDGSIPAVVSAMSTAVDEIWAEFITDLGTVTPPRS